MHARTAIYCLQQLGREDEASALLALHSDIVARTRTARGPWLISGPEIAFDHALHGDYEGALTALEELVDDDWRFYWWGLDFYHPSLLPLVGMERFEDLMQRLEEGVAQQRLKLDALLTAQ